MGINALLILGTGHLLGAVSAASLMHLIIDSIKYILLLQARKKNDGNLFIFDQGLHIIGLFLIAFILAKQHHIIYPTRIASEFLNSFHYNAEVVVRWILSLLLIHKPVNLMIQNFLSNYKPRGDHTVIKADRRAGRYIGTIERMIMLIFLSMDQYAAISRTIQKRHSPSGHAASAAVYFLFRFRRQASRPLPTLPKKVSR